jgi:steroid delta-isomerase-like uncharacterized protein
MAKNADLIRRWFEEVWNQGREETIDAMCAPEAVGHGQTLDGSDIIGPEHFKQFWHQFRAGFNSIHVDIHQTIEEGDMVMARWSLTMTHMGPFLGVKASGKRVTTKGMSVQRFAGGKIVEAWDNWDQLGVLAQMGMISLPRPE